MNSPDEISLVNQVRTGDRDAFKTLYTQHFSALVNVAIALSGETVHAKDLVQDVFVQFWNKRQALQIKTAVFPYLRKMVIHAYLAEHRKTERRSLLWQQRHEERTFHQDPEDQLHLKETETAIRAAIDALPERCGEIFKLSRFNEMTYPEIAEALDISVKTVENQMGKALRELRESLKEFRSNRNQTQY